MLTPRTRREGIKWLLLINEGGQPVGSLHVLILTHSLVRRNPMDTADTCSGEMSKESEEKPSE